METGGLDPLTNCVLREGHVFPNYIQEQVTPDPPRPLTGAGRDRIELVPHHCKSNASGRNDHQAKAEIIGNRAALQCRRAGHGLTRNGSDFAG